MMPLFYLSLHSVFVQHHYRSGDYKRWRRTLRSCGPCCEDNELSEPEKCVLDKGSNTTDAEMNGNGIHCFGNGIQWFSTKMGELSEPGKHVLEPILLRNFRR